MTQSEFIKSYCEASNIDEMLLNNKGHFAIVCDCGVEECQGWAMITRALLQPQIDLYIKQDD